MVTEDANKTIQGTIAQYGDTSGSAFYAISILERSKPRNTFDGYSGVMSY